MADGLVVRRDALQRTEVECFAGREKEELVEEVECRGGRLVYARYDNELECFGQLLVASFKPPPPPPPPTEDPDI